MSIFLTRPVINTKEERNAKADILAVSCGGNDIKDILSDRGLDLDLFYLLDKL